MMEIVSKGHDHRKQWLRLEPDLLAALEELAEKEGKSLEALIVTLVHEAITHRLRHLISGEAIFGSI